MKAEFRIKLRQWAKKLIIFAVVILLIFVIARIIGALVQWTSVPIDNNRQNEIKNFYDTPIFGSTELKDEKKFECANVISDFVKYGNNKDYEQVFAMLSDEYKELKMQDITKVKEYIDRYFDTQKGFSYQNIINNNSTYIYELKIYDDLMISGSNSYTTGNQNKIYFVIKDNESELKVNLDGFISKQNVELSSQNEYIKFTLFSKEVYYNEVKFNLRVENLTDDRVLSVYSNDIKYLLYTKDTNKVTEYSNSEMVSKTTANVIMPNTYKAITMTYAKYVGSSLSQDYRININKVYSYDLIDYMEVIFDNPNITDKAKETYSNIYISL